MTRELLQTRLEEIIQWLIKVRPNDHLDAISTIRDAKAALASPEPPMGPVGATYVGGVNPATIEPDGAPNDVCGSTPHASTSPEPEPVAWRCFHCDEVFADRAAAADHFGCQEDGVADDVGCKLNATEGGILKMLREAQLELRTYHQEDDAQTKQFYVLGAEHAVALRKSEEEGYARGLSDAAADALCGRQGWQDIETAPKVGEFLVWVRRAGTMSILVVHYCDFVEDHPPIAPALYFWTGFQFAPLKDKPTHWQPLPPPPTPPSVRDEEG